MLGLSAEGLPVSRARGQQGQVVTAESDTYGPEDSLFAGAGSGLGNGLAGVAGLLCGLCVGLTLRLADCSSWTWLLLGL